MRTLTSDATAGVVGFARALRAAGVPAGPDRVAAFLAALGRLDPARRGDVYWAGRSTLCGGPDDLERYDRVFAAFFDGERPPPRRARPAVRPVRPYALPRTGRAERATGQEEGGPAATSPASATEVLRHRDVAAMTAAERDQLHRLLAVFALDGEPRRSSRRRPARRGGVDPRRTMRELLRRGGEPAALLRRAPARKPRRVVLLLDVSGSMAPYADALLRFAHAAAHGSRNGPPTEVFTLGTRLTRVTREMARRDPDAALAAVGAAVPDWSGGTRLGKTLRAFLDRWGARGTARGAVVVVLSDGWERGARLCWPRRCGGWRGWRTAWCGPTHARPARGTLRWRRGWRRRCRASTSSWRGTAWARWNVWPPW